MAEGLTTHQHGSLVQLLPCFVLPADIHLALIPPSGSSIYPVIRDIFYLPGMGSIDGSRILGSIPMDVGALVNVLPYLFLWRCIFNPFHNLRRILACNGAQTRSAALPVPHKGKSTYPGTGGRPGAF